MAQQINLTPTEKKLLLARYIELLVLNQIDIAEIVGRPLSYFDFDKIQQGIEKYTMEKDPCLN